MSIHVNHKKKVKSVKVKKTAYSKKIKEQVKKRMLSDGAKCRASGGTFDNQTGACTKVIRKRKGIRGAKDTKKGTKKTSRAVLELGIRF
jgi:hypothetical protein